jgi:hypothetical protein
MEFDLIVVIESFVNIDELLEPHMYEQNLISLDLFSSLFARALAST